MQQATLNALRIQTFRIPEFVTKTIKSAYFRLYQYLSYWDEENDHHLSEEFFQGVVDNLMATVRLFGTDISGRDLFVALQNFYVTGNTAMLGSVSGLPNFDRLLPSAIGMRATLEREELKYARFLVNCANTYYNTDFTNRRTLRAAALFIKRDRPCFYFSVMARIFCSRVSAYTNIFRSPAMETLWKNFREDCGHIYRPSHARARLHTPRVDESYGDIEDTDFGEDTDYDDFDIDDDEI